MVTAATTAADTLSDTKLAVAVPADGTGDEERARDRGTGGGGASPSGNILPIAVMKDAKR